MGNVNDVWPLTADNFDKAAAAFNTAKPNNSQIAGIALIYKDTKYVWSVNYEVIIDGLLPIPSVENIILARSIFEDKAPYGAIVHTVDVCNIKPGGILHTKWQVTYSANSNKK